MPNSNILIVSEPSSAQDFETYYRLRFDVLRKPWGQPLDSEKDDTDGTSIHAFIKINNEAVAVARLHFIDHSVAQIRYMGVHPGQQGKGLGKLVIQYLEKRALQNERKIIILHARENAVKFYESCGYKTKEKSYLMWNQIQHFLMEKDFEK